MIKRMKEYQDLIGLDLFYHSAAETFPELFSADCLSVNCWEKCSKANKEL